MTFKPSKVKFLLQQDKHDHRDLVYKKKWFQVFPLPSSVDLSSKCSPVENQENLGSCGPNAGAGLWEYRMKQSSPSGSYMDISRLFWYWITRMQMGTISEDSGVSLRDQIKAAAKFGVCGEKLWKYYTTKFKQRPTEECFREALSNKIKSYLRISTIEDIKSNLASGSPVMIGMAVYQSMMDESISKTGLVPLPSTSEECLGGHAVLVVGYDSKMITKWGTGAFLVRNSWGSDWGLEGYFWLPYSYLEAKIGNQKLWMDGWTFTI